MLDLRKLNKEQKRAVVHKKGPLLIIAGPGTGKTSVITSRIAYLIEKEKVDPENILALTFTDKAAGEMEERTGNMISPNFSDLWISTFHSFCDRILRENGLNIGISTDFKIVEGVGINLLIKRNIDKFRLDYYRPLGSPNKFVGSLIDYFSRLKDQAITPEEYLEFIKNTNKDDRKRTRELARAYAVYQKILLESNYLDFGDLINYTFKLFQKRPLVLEKYRQKFKYILIDEFQDTNYSQYELIKLLSLPTGNITVCADGNQAIYRWRGASFENISRFQKDYFKVKKVVLTKNYRSLQNILDLSHKFIGYSDRNDLIKKLIAHRKGKGVVDHLHFKTAENELNGVIEKIIEISKKEKDNFNEFAILTRSNNEANLMALACQRAGLPHHFISLKGLYQKPIILDIIAYFNLLDNYHESSAVYRVLNFSLWEISPEEISEITRYSHRKFESIYNVLKSISLVSGISSRSKEKIDKIIDLIKRHTILAGRKNVSEVFISFLQDSGYLKYLSEKGTKEDIDHINQFYSRIKRFEESSIDPKLSGFMEELNLELDSGESGKLEVDLENRENAVSIMTIHTAKGLEFKYVFIINMVDRKFPTNEKRNLIEIPDGLKKDGFSEDGVHLEEERKLFYVAMTRAKNKLFFTSAKDYGGLKRKKLSRFLIELGHDSDNNLEAKERMSQKKPFNKGGKEKISIPDYFSFTQLEAFSRCPLQYKFAHIFKIPLHQKSTFVFGKTIHNTLYYFVKYSLQGRTSLKKFQEIYDENWINEWYENKKQRDKYYRLGKRIINDFYSSFKSSSPRIAFIKKSPALEKSFTLNIGGETIKGKIDRIDEIEGGFEIIDYKTGKAKKKLKKEEKKQLLIYQIAAEDFFKLNPIKLTYYYLDEGRIISFIGNEKEKQETKKDIVDRIKEIKKGDFKPKPGWHCQYCDFRKICGKG